jgi:hypothetical protein
MLNLEVLCWNEITTYGKAHRQPEWYHRPYLRRVENRKKRRVRSGVQWQIRTTSLSRHIAPQEKTLHQPHYGSDTNTGFSVLTMILMLAEIGEFAPSPLEFIIPVGSIPNP